MVDRSTKIWATQVMGLRRRAAGGFTLMELAVVVVIIAALAGMVVNLVDRSEENAELTVARANLRIVSEAIFGSAAGMGYFQDMKHVPESLSDKLRIHNLFSASTDPNAVVFDRVANRGWRGPYLRRSGGVANTDASRYGLFPASDDRRFAGDTTFLSRGFYAITIVGTIVSDYGKAGDFAVGDPWGNPIVIQVPPQEAFEYAADDAKRLQYVRLVSAGADGKLSTPLSGPLGRLAGKIDKGTAEARGDDLVYFPNRADVYEKEY